MKEAKFPRRSIRSSMSSKNQSPFLNNDLLENVSPRYENFDPKLMGIVKPSYYDEPIFTTLCKKSDYSQSANCYICQKPFGIFSKSKHCKFCGNVVCQDDSLKKRPNPVNPNKPLRICSVCEDKYLGKRIYDEFFGKKQNFDKKMEELRFQYDLFDEGLKSMKNTVNNMDFDRQKSIRDNLELIEEKKNILEQTKKNSNEFEQKIKKLTEDLAATKKNISTLRKNIAEIDEKNRDLKEQKNDMDSRMKAIDLDIEQTKFLIEEQKAMQKMENYEKKAVQEKSIEEEKKIKKNKGFENNDSFLTSQTQEDRETQSSFKSSKIFATSYPVDEKIKSNDRNYYPCYVCRIF